MRKLKKQWLLCCSWGCYCCVRIYIICCVQVWVNWVSHSFSLRHAWLDIKPSHESLILLITKLDPSKKVADAFFVTGTTKLPLFEEIDEVKTARLNWQVNPNEQNAYITYIHSTVHIPQHNHNHITTNKAGCEKAHRNLPFMAGIMATRQDLPSGWTNDPRYDGIFSQNFRI